MAVETSQQAEATDPVESIEVAEVADVGSRVSKLDSTKKATIDAPSNSKIHDSQTNDKTRIQSDPKKAPPVEVEFNSFSAAFVNVLQSIHEGEVRQRPTPARSNPEVAPESLVDVDLVDVEKSPAETSSKRTLDLATEIVSKHAVPEKTPTFPAPEKVEPSVAGPDGITGKQSGKKPLSSQLDQYFDGLKLTPESKNKAPHLASLDKTPAASSKAGPAASPTDATRTVVASPSQANQLETPNRIPPREPNVRITRRMALLQPRIARSLKFYFDRPLNTGDDSAWSVMHSMLGYGPKGWVAINHERGQRTNVVHWLCQNGLCANRRLLYLDNGYIKGLEGPGYQGHPGQFLAMLAQIGIERDFPLNVQGNRFTLEALINSEMYTCSSSKELTFKLISLSYYLDSTTKWRSENGEVWDVPTILAIELSQPVNGAACGGTHRIMSISCAIRNRWIRGEPLDGVYAKAEQYVRQYQRYALSLQNSDGSFSTEWFKRPAAAKDRDRQLQTTGHILEWLVYTLPRNELSDPRIVAAVEFLTNLMTRHRYHDWEVGPRGHAIRALSLYHQRVFERQRPATPQMANLDIWSSILR